MNMLIRRLIIFVFFFFVGGAIGSVAFILWTGGAQTSYRSHHRWAREWVEEQSAEDLKRYTKYVFLAGGAIAAGSVFVMLVKYDTGRES